MWASKLHCLEHRPFVGLAVAKTSAPMRRAVAPLPFNSPGGGVNQHPLTGSERGHVLEGIWRCQESDRQGSRFGKERLGDRDNEARVPAMATVAKMA
jgi:hypothetical protein